MGPRRDVFLAKGVVLVQTPGEVRAGRLVRTIDSFEFVGTDKAYSSKQIRVALKALKGLNCASACTAESPGAYTTILTSLVAQYIEKQARNALFKTFLKHHSVVKLPNHMISDMGSTLHVLKLMKSPFLKNPFVSQDVVVIVS